MVPMWFCSLEPVEGQKRPKKAKKERMEDVSKSKNKVKGSNGERKQAHDHQMAAEIDHAAGIWDGRPYELPPPSNAISHLKDRLRGVVVDAYRLSRAYRYDLPEDFEDHIGRAHGELVIWERHAKIKWLSQTQQAKANKIKVD
jgi:hypothetical protein